uniref:Somatolactin alpha n=1 Tax=Salmo trutta TaxID=8032 RepID=A0A674BR88_SALTR
FSTTVLQGGVWAVLLWPCLLSLGVPLECKDEQGSITHCASISQEKLLERVIQHAELIYSGSESFCTLIVSTIQILPHLDSGQSESNETGGACTITKLKLCSLNCVVPDKWLLHSVLMLVQSWSEPSTKWVSEKLLSLEQGVVVLIRKMLDEGMQNTSYYEQGVTPYNLQPEVLESVLRDYTLLSCFKKDPHKLETFLKLLKCHQTDKYSCFLYERTTISTPFKTHPIHYPPPLHNEASIKHFSSLHLVPPHLP